MLIHIFLDSQAHFKSESSLGATSSSRFPCKLGVQNVDRLALMAVTNPLFPLTSSTVSSFKKTGWH